MEIFNIIPLPTKFSILFLVILPAFAVIYLRFSLHTRLQSINHRVARLLISDEAEGIQPEIVTRLRIRYQTASQKLEHVNTIALIDSIYQDETISYGKFQFQFDRIDSITRVLPNLLIAFGLIGTFLGITSNLTNISTIVTGFSQSNPNIGGLVQGLQKPLQDMGTAFSSSLVGLLFGSGLTIVNTIYNTSIAKYQLVSGLEDYLDNIYKPTVEGHSRIDRAIDRMVTQQHEFLLRFHENVGAVLKDTLGEAANKITEESSRINQIAENIYTNFSNAAGTISTGANTFEQAANSLDTKTKTLADALDRFTGGIDTFRIAANQLEQNNIVQNIDRVLTELNTTQQAFTTSTQTLQDALVGITDSNQTAAQLARQVYETWQDSTTQIVAAAETIQIGTQNFERAAQTMQDSSRSIDLTLTNAVNQWQNTQTEFGNSTAIFSQASQHIEPVAAKLTPAIASIDRAVNSLQQIGSQIVNLSKNTAQSSEYIQTAITGFDRNYYQVLTTTQSSIQNIAEVNSTSWQKLVDSLERQNRSTEYNQPPSIQLQQQN